MPIPSRWMIRCSLLYLLAGFMIGALMLVSKAWPAYPQVWITLPVHIEILIFGFIIQFTMGTTYWILPRYLETGDRGNRFLAVAMAVLFNSGVLVNIFTYLNIIARWGTIAGRSMEVISVMLFIALHWNRAASYRG